MGGRARARKASGEYGFVIMRNYPGSRCYELMDKKKDFLSSLLEKMGLKKESL